MDPSSSLIAQFCGVTNADESLAKQLLRDSGLDLEAAISSFFAIQEAGGLPSSNGEPSQPDTSSNPPPIDLEQAVREPIPQMADRLLPETPYVNHPPPGPVEVEPFADNDHLAELFRPPTHLIFPGSLDEAMTAGARQKRWVLVNIQSRTEFASHCLNRDVWSDVTVEQLLQAQFIFWQRDENAQQGVHYKRFYPYDRLPHVALVDPRNGERVRVWGDDSIDRIGLLTELQDFVTRNSLDDDSAIRGSSQQAASTRNPKERQTSAGPSSVPDTQMSEDSLLAAAIAASMEGREADMNAAHEARMESAFNNVNGNGTESDRAASRLLSATNPVLSHSRSLRAQQDTEYKESLALDRAMEQSKRDEADRQEKAKRAEEERLAAVKEAREQRRRRVPVEPPEGVKEGVRELMIRLPDGKRLQRRFYASNTVGNVYDYIESEVESLSDGTFELMQPYPKKSFARRDVTLENLPGKAALVVGIKA